jgi:hypothetical protein
LTQGKGKDKSHDLPQAPAVPGPGRTNGIDLKSNPLDSIRSTPMDGLEGGKNLVFRDKTFVRHPPTTRQFRPSIRPSWPVTEDLLVYSDPNPALCGEF